MTAKCLVDSTYPPTRFRNDARVAVIYRDRAKLNEALDGLALWVDAYAYNEFLEEIEDLESEIQEASGPEALAS